MLSASSDIIKSFVSALSSITYEGESVPVYVNPPKGVGGLYIQLGTVTTVEEGCKDLFGHECTIDVQVIDTGARNYSTPKRVEEVSQVVSITLKPDELSTVSMSNFDMIYLTLDNSFNDQGLFSSDRAYRKIMQFRFMVMENDGGDWILSNGIWTDGGVWIDTAVWID